MRGVMAASSCSGSSAKPVAAVVDTSTGVPPLNRIAGRYATYDGSCRITSSPGSMIAAIAAATASDAPTVMQISVSGLYDRPYSRSRCVASARRSSSVPKLLV